MLKACFLRRSNVLSRASALIGTRAIHFSPSILAALAFGMPAMSPTMTEGGVVLWKFKPGDLFNAGDVLLEVETDKATIDVEVTDDGVLWKILEQDGATAIPVGQPIAYLAEPGDDLLSLLIPESKLAEPASSVSKQDSQSMPESSPSTTSSSLDSSPAPSTCTEIFHPANPNQKLSPSVELLLHEHGISRDDALAQISASGPNGRLLQGDVLAHVGAIKKDSIEHVMSYVKSRQHLDLSNITLATPEELKRFQQMEAQEIAQEKTDSASQAPKIPANIRNLSLVSVLAEPIAKSDFLYAVRQAISDATRDAYSLKFPQYTISPLDSGLTDSSDSLFDQLMTPSVTQNRFEVVSISCKLESSVSSVVDQEEENLFDDLMSVPKLVRNSHSEQGPITMVVDATIRLNERVGDSSEVYNVFKNALQARYPAEHLNIIG